MPHSSDENVISISGDTYHYFGKSSELSHKHPWYGREEVGLIQWSMRMIKFLHMPGIIIKKVRNPFQVLIPSHRLLTKSNSLKGFYPLGIEVKRKLLEIEGAKWQEKSK